jgi:hypothetical protein
MSKPAANADSNAIRNSGNCGEYCNGSATVLLSSTVGELIERKIKGRKTKVVRILNANWWSDRATS